MNKGQRIIASLLSVTAVLLLLNLMSSTTNAQANTHRQAVALGIVEIEKGASLPPKPFVVRMWSDGAIELWIAQKWRPLEDHLR